MTLIPLRAEAGQPPGLDTGVSGRRSAQIGELTLESGRVLPDVRMAYQTWGTLNSAGDNAVLVLHALTGDSHVVGPAGPDQPTPGWWDGLIGPGAPLDDRRYFVVAANVLGGCRGSTGPATPAPDGKPWGSRFPRLTPRDQVRAEAALADLIGIKSFAAVIGGSMGGMRALEWAIMYPERVRRCVAIATTPYFSGDQIAWSVPQLAAIRTDPNFRGGDYYDGPPPLAGMAVARQIAHVTYRSARELNERFGRAPQPGEQPAEGGRFAVQSYLDHHGDKLGRRFDPNSYLVLTESMNAHDIGRGRGGVDAALARIRAELTVAVVDSDRLFPPEQGALLAAAPTARPLITIRSDFGHDGFLIEAEQVAAVVRGALGGVYYGR
ncbi:homoserine O-acetyltransferase [Micromonospora qiuiae]|uniref:Homoserine O-acetyltransferase n=1 Tax=Micromonospora qiuiae TaxID=502268 RepID=A0ABQ4J6X3_9ACTN|nr:homoserine O-acetyltransferase [Micromonospora qiuiae]GIJ25918.1 homoserine O-acetyltransferase [Micromonospora qiuiae]